MMDPCRARVPTELMGVSAQGPIGTPFGPPDLLPSLPHPPCHDERDGMLDTDSTSHYTKQPCTITDKQATERGATTTTWNTCKQMIANLCKGSMTYVKTLVTNMILDNETQSDDNCDPTTHNTNYSDIRHNDKDGIVVFDATHSITTHNTCSVSGYHSKIYGDVDNISDTNYSGAGVGYSKNGTCSIKYSGNERAQDKSMCSRIIGDMAGQAASMLRYMLIFAMVIPVSAVGTQAELGIGANGMLAAIGAAAAVQATRLRRQARADPDTVADLEPDKCNCKLCEECIQTNEGWYGDDMWQPRVPSEGLSVEGKEGCAKKIH